jgi:hypothetical protein
MSVISMAVRSWSAVTLDTPMWRIRPSVFIPASVSMVSSSGVSVKTPVWEVVEVDVLQPQAAHAHVGRLTQVPLAASGSHVRVFGVAAKQAPWSR